MATIHTLIDYDRQNPTAISREAYEDVGADAFAPGTFPRAFVDLEVWDAASGGNQLVLDTDYELVGVDLELSGANYEDETVYTTLRIINAGYQADFIYLTYGAVGTYPTALLHDPTGLPAAAALGGTEPIATVQSGEAVKATVEQIAVFATTPVFKAISADYTITDDDANIFSLTAGAVDRVITLPLLANGSPGDEYELVKADSGAGKGTLAAHATDADLIDGTDDIDIDSQYDRVRVRHMGTWWKVVAYEDHGSNAGGQFARYADGRIEAQEDAFQLVYVNTVRLGAVWTFPAAVIATDFVVNVTIDDAASLETLGYTKPGMFVARHSSTTTSEIRLYKDDVNFAAGNLILVGLRLSGRWRT